MCVLFYFILFIYLFYLTIDCVSLVLTFGYNVISALFLCSVLHLNTIPNKLHNILFKISPIIPKYFLK